jgi:CAAX protease family protein
MSDAREVARPIFRNDEGELRSGWRVLAFFILVLILSIVFGSAALLIGGLLSSEAGSLQAPPSASGTTLDAIYFGIDKLISLLAAVAATAICVRFLERRSLASVGYKLHPGWARDAAIGLLVGLLSLAVAVGISSAGGAVDFTMRHQPAGQVLWGGLALVMALFFSAAFEELLFRGFPFQALLHNVGPVWAIALTSCAFGLLHLANPNVTVFSTVNIMLAGVWLGTAYLKTRSLWLPTALHFAWNYATVFLFGLPVSGIRMYRDLALLRGEAGTPVWLTGGTFGPEGGAAATIMLALSTMIILKGGFFSASAEMIEAAEHDFSPPRISIPAASVQDG